MEAKGEVLYEIGPKYDFFYELISPTGKKMRSSLLAMIIAIALKIITICMKSSIISFSEGTFNHMYNTISIILWVLVIFSIIVFVLRVVFQSLEYKGMKYKFYNDCFTVENNFLNQTKKTVEYANIKEIEIRKTILDRILNYGIIIIYTNAEKSYGSATILYAIKDIEKHYEKIDKLVHNLNAKNV